MKQHKEIEGDLVKATTFKWFSEGALFPRCQRGLGGKAGRSGENSDACSLHKNSATVRNVGCRCVKAREGEAVSDWKTRISAVPNGEWQRRSYSGALERTVLVWLSGWPNSSQRQQKRFNDANDLLSSLFRKNIGQRQTFHSSSTRQKMSWHSRAAVTRCRQLFISRDA